MIFVPVLNVVSESETAEKNVKKNAKICRRRGGSYSYTGTFTFLCKTHQNFQTVTQSDADVERQSEKRIMRRQELQELRKLQVEEQRKMAALQHKLGTQTEQLSMKCEREIYVSYEG